MQLNIIHDISFLINKIVINYSKKGKKSKNMEDKEERFIVSVKVGPKGQITIPIEARKMFDIKEGDTLMVMGDKSRGIALLKADLFYSIMEENK